MNHQQERSLIRHPMAKWALFMGFLFALWFGGWFAFARFADGKIGDAIAGIGQRGITVDCKNREMRGFPFRIGVHCDKVTVAHNRDVFRFESGALRTAAQLYAPGEMVAELDGPFKAWPGGRELTANWSMMRMFVDGKFDGGFDIASLNFAKLAVQIGDESAAADEGAVHFRPTPPANKDDQPYRSLDAAFDIVSLSTSSPALQIPAVRLVFDGTLVDGYRDVVLSRQPLQSVLADGAEVDVRRLTLALQSGGMIALSGPISLGDDGLLSGEINIGVSDAAKLASQLSVINPQLANAVNGIGQAVAGMGKPVKYGEDEVPSISVKMDRGVIRLGFIQIARIPPLTFN